MPLDWICPVPLAGAPARPQVTLDQRADRIVGDRWVSWAARLRPVRMRVADQRQRTAGFEDLEHRFGDTLTVCPVEGLAERHQSELPQIQCGQALGERTYPLDVVDPCFSGPPC